MSFNGVVNKSRAGTTVILVVPNGEQLWISERLYFLATIMSLNMKLASVD